MQASLTYWGVYKHNSRYSCCFYSWPGIYGFCAPCLAHFILVDDETIHYCHCYNLLAAEPCALLKSSRWSIWKMRLSGWWVCLAFGFPDDLDAKANIALRGVSFQRRDVLSRRGTYICLWFVHGLQRHGMKSAVKLKVQLLHYIHFHSRAPRGIPRHTMTEVLGRQVLPMSFVFGGI